MKFTILLPAFVILLAGCDNLTTPSGNVSTTSMYAIISGIDDGQQTTIITQLKTASGNQYPDITLESGDTLYVSDLGPIGDINQNGGLDSFGGSANVSNNIKTLQERNMVLNDLTQDTLNHPEYSAVFSQTNGAGHTYYLNFEREKYTSVHDVPITITDPFQLNTSLPGEITRSTPLQASWVASGDSTQTMSYQAVWFCDDGTIGYSTQSTSTNDTGSVPPIDQTTLVDQNTSAPIPSVPCTISLVVYRTKTQNVPFTSSGFGLGTKINGIQRRSLSFYSTP